MQHQQSFLDIASSLPSTPPHAPNHVLPAHTVLPFNHPFWLQTITVQVLKFSVGDVRLSPSEAQTLQMIKGAHRVPDPCCVTSCSPRWACCLLCWFTFPCRCESFGVLKGVIWLYSHEIDCRPLSSLFHFLFTFGFTTSPLTSGLHGSVMGRPLDYQGCRIWLMMFCLSQPGVHLQSMFFFCLVQTLSPKVELCTSPHHPKDHMLCQIGGERSRITSQGRG